MVIPIMAACLLARAAASLFSPTPVYKDFAERLILDYERQRAEADALASAPADEIGPTSTYGEPVAPAPPKPEESER